MGRLLTFDGFLGPILLAAFCVGLLTGDPGACAPRTPMHGASASSR